MSPSEPVELEAFRELQQLVRHLGDELSSFRRRALQAEARLRQLEGSEGPSDAPAPHEVQALEAENARLRSRLEAATGRTQQMLDRVKFLRQQQERETQR